MLFIGCYELKKLIMISEKLFYNKDLCDIVRDIAMNSPCNIETALIILKRSSNHKRDADFIKKLSCNGISEKQINVFITVINNEL